MSQSVQKAQSDGGAQGPVAPSLSLPKGGGAIRGIGEKFAANPVTGTGSLSVPIYVSPGREGFNPSLTLSYDSGAGNGLFGLGWSLSLPSITRKTDKGLPQYRDDEESDVFLIAGSEDLVPLLTHTSGGWRQQPLTRTFEGVDYRVQAYRPRVEGLFARVERWTQIETGRIHWRSITKENVTTLYGKDDNSRIYDPAESEPGGPRRIFSWLICESFDGKGNAVVYEYKAENAEGVDLSQARERNRTSQARTANRYLKRIKYGNRVSRLVEPDASDPGWMFEVVFDYGEHDADAPQPDDDGEWLCRNDPFSVHRATFEVRTYRLCQRVLMFHHFPEEVGVGNDCLVRSTDFVYQNTRDNSEDLKRGNPIASFVASVTNAGYQRTPGGYLKRAMPPVEFEYSQPEIQEEIREVDGESLENLPVGLDGSLYQWVDLDGEGLPGILTRQANAWLYKRNLSPVGLQSDGGNERPEARFGPVEVVALQPAAGDSAGRQLLDLAGDGQLDLVQFERPLAGYYERVDDGGWSDFEPFQSIPDISWRDPNLRFVDLTGDGHADACITEDSVLTWYPSLAEDGFGPAERVCRQLDEESGPRLVFADGTQSVYLADMSGDGLLDFVRVLNGEVSYWPNLGYGRFGARVSMDGAPVFDRPELFDQRRIRLVDVDGSGVTDILYLGGDGLRIYFNEAGNSWSAPRRLPQFPPVDDLITATTADLFGNGTACLIWSSPLPGASRRPMRYIDLMGGRKPHLLVGVRNNMGAETLIQYAPSTRFYLEDKLAGTPWVTRLPFPVHVVERTESVDLISRSRFVTRYSYHHGYFDGSEREFRGFGMVERYDTEEFAALSGGGLLPSASNVEAASHVPPVLTRTWFDVGAPSDERPAGKQFEHEYYREGGAGAAQLSEAQLDAMRLKGTALPGSVKLKNGSRVPWELSPDELAEARRALKGSILRVEVYALDGGEQSDRPYSVSERSYTVELLQPRGANRHGVFFVQHRETVDFHYERKLYAAPNGKLADPRVTHSLTLAADSFGNVLESAAIAYGRRRDNPDPLLNTADREKQSRTFVTYTQSSYTNPVEEPDAYRMPLMCETRTFELYNVKAASNRPNVTNLFSFEEVAAGVAAAGDGQHEVPYENHDAVSVPQDVPRRRVIEHKRVVYRRDDLTVPLQPGELESLALGYGTYRLAFTPGLLASVYQRPRVNQPPENLLPDPAAVLGDEGGYVDLDGDGSWWIPSGRIYYHPGEAATPAQELAQARAHFFLPRRYQNPFLGNTFVSYDEDPDGLAYDLLTSSVRDALGNEVGGRNNYRVLQPELLTDANGNRSAAGFDALGMVVATAFMGKEAENAGDSLDGFAADLDEQTIIEHLSNPLADPHAILGGASERIVYDLHRYQRTSGTSDPQPNAVYRLARETHVSDLAPGEVTKVQHSFSYSDGFGREIQQKIQAEPGPVAGGAPTSNPRWVGSGWTIFNNKNKPVRKYEPFFSATHEFEFAAGLGVSPILFYDPVERVVATLRADHTYEKIVLDPWRQEKWDVNDNVLEDDPRNDPAVGRFFARLPEPEFLPTWHARRAGGALGADEQAAAHRTAVHAATPGLAFSDALGHTFLAVSHNRFEVGGSPVEEQHATRFGFDVEGNQRTLTDALGREVMSYDYSMLGIRIGQQSVDAGARWMLNDAVGKPLRLWDSRDQNIRHEYDELRRTVRLFVRTSGGAERLAQQVIYGEGQQGDSTLNLRGRLFQQLDAAGVVTNNEYDFKGNLRSNTRQLLQDYKAEPDWNLSPALESELFTTETVYDALNRPTVLTTPDTSITRPTYNEANLLEQLAVNLRGAADAVTYVNNIDYNARGQRERVEYGNGTITEFDYDPESFRLVNFKTTRTADGVVLQDLSYTYDPVGNITNARDAAQQTVYFNNQVVSAGRDYVYDAVYRLVGAQGREHVGQAAQPQTTWDDEFRLNQPHPHDGQAMRRYTESFEYDAAGNILKMIHAAVNGNWTRVYNYDEPSATNNRLTSTAVGASVEQYAFDAHGNIVQMPHLPSLEWDFRDQLRVTQQQVVNGGAAEKTFYVYDAAGARVRKVTEGAGGTKKQERVYLGAFELYREFDGGGATTLERETLNLMDKERRVALVETKTHDAVQPPNTPPAVVARYQFGDHLGSATLELDEAGAVISYEEYYPYGGTSFQAGPSAAEVSLKRYRYAGKERDRETGFYYHGARYYVPWLGRWSSCDPAGVGDGVNLYCFVHDNPVSLRDTDGRAGSPPANSDYFNDITPAILAILKKNDINFNKAVFLVTQAYSEQGPSTGVPSRGDNRIFNHHGTDKDLSEKFGADKVGEMNKKLDAKETLDFGGGVHLKRISQNESTDLEHPEMLSSPTYTYDNLEASVTHHLELLDKRFATAHKVLKDSKGTFEQYATALRSYGHLLKDKEKTEREAKLEKKEKITEEKLMTYDEILIQKRFSQVRREYTDWVLYQQKNIVASIKSDKNYVAYLTAEIASNKEKYAEKYAEFEKTGKGSEELYELNAQRAAMQSDLAETEKRLKSLDAVQTDINALAKALK
ncbi:MAG: SpvB/TcaC N-terminal domain-containing protein [Pyrinomonadaceae bacterium]